MNTDSTSYNQLLQMNEELQKEVDRLTKELTDLKVKYDINMTDEEMETMYKDYYSSDNEFIHI